MKIWHNGVIRELTQEERENIEAYIEETLEDRIKNLEAIINIIKKLVNYK